MFHANPALVYLCFFYGSGSTELRDICKYSSNLLDFDASNELQSNDRHYGGRLESFNGMLMAIAGLGSNSNDRGHPLSTAEQFNGSNWTRLGFPRKIWSS